MSTTTTIEAQSTVVENRASDEKNEGLVGTLLDLGFAWAAYGLKIATNAVEHSSKTLSITAKALDQLADHFAEKSSAADEPAIAKSAK